MRWVVRVIVIVLVFAGLVLGSMAYISRNDFALVRNELVNRISERMGKQLVIEGAINIKASLVPTVTIAGIKLENAPWATEPWLLTAERLDVRIRLIPALIGNYSISDARLHQVQLNLEIDENDVQNWEPETLVDTGEGERKADPVLFIQDLTLDDINVVLADRRTGETHTLGIKRLKLHAKDADTPVAIELDGHLNHKLLRIFGQIGTWKQLNNSIFAHVDLKAEYTDARVHITGGPKSGVSHSLDHLVFRLEASGLDIREFQSFFLQELPETRSFHLLASLESEGTELHTTIEKLEIENENASMHVSGIIDNLYSPESLELQWQTEGKDIAQLATVFGLPGLPSTESFTAHSRVLLRDGILALKEINFEAIKGAISARVTGHVDDAEEFSGIALQANLHGEDARQLGAIVGIKLPATDAFLIHTGLTDSKGLLAAKDFKVEIQQGDLGVIFTGQVADLTRLSGIDATLDVSGVDLADLDRLIAPLTKDQVSNLLPGKESSKGLSERFTLTAKLNGSLKKISADKIKARIERYGAYFEFSGAIGDVIQFKELDIGFKSWGESLANLSEFFVRELPRTGSFRVSGQMSGRIVDPVVEGIAVHVQFEAHEFTASGYLGQLSDLQAMNIEINAEGDDLQRIGDEFGVNLPDSNSYQLSTRLRMRDNAMVFEDLVLKQERRGLNAEYRGAIFDVLDQPQFELEFVARGRDSQNIGMFLGMQPLSVGAFEYGATFKGNMQRIAINDFYAKFGETNFWGQATFIPGDKIRIENAHISGRIDLTPWRKHGKGRGKKVIDGEFARRRIFSTTPIPFDDLSRFDLDLLVDELTISDVLAVVTLEEARIRIQSGVMLADPLIVRYQNAIVTGDLELRAGSSPTVRLDVLAEGFDLGKYLAETRGLNGISAKLDLQINVTGEGQSIAEIMSNLDGEFHFLVTDGLLPRTKVSLRVTDFFTNAFAFLKNKPNLVIACALTHAIIQNGRASHEVVFLDSDQMILSGAGTIDLSEETLDFVLAPRPKKQRLFSTEFDVNVKGSILAPELSLNKASATTTALKKYGAFSILGPAGLLLPAQRSKVGDHACVKSISELQD